MRAAAIRGRCRRGKLQATRGDIQPNLRLLLRQPAVTGQLLVIIPSLLDHFQAALGGRQGMARFLDGQLLHLPYRFKQRDLLIGPEQGQFLGILLLEGAQQRAAEAAHGLVQRISFLKHHREAVVRQWSTQICQRARQVDARRASAHQHAGIDRRLEQRQLPHHALDVHAVAYLEEAVGDGVPILQQLIVGWNAEVEVGLPQGRSNAVCHPFTVKRGVEQGVLHSDDRIALRRHRACSL